MGFPLYSVSFVKSSITGAAITYYVPSGKRAVVRVVSASNSGATAGKVYVSIGGTYVVVGSVPVLDSRHFTGLAHVAYAGEAISLFNDQAGMGAVVSGYLFDDATGAQADYLSAELDRVLEHEPLPVEGP